MRTMTKRMRLATYGSPHTGEDTRLAQNCKSLPVPAFVSKTCGTEASSPLLLSPRPKVWTTAPRSQSILVLYTVVWGKVLCFVVFVDGAMAAE